MATSPQPHRPEPRAHKAKDATDRLSVGERIERDRQRKLREWRRRRNWAAALFTLGALVGVSHVIEHLGVFTLYRSGVDDLIAGYPLALGLIIAGAIKLPPRSL